MIIPGMVSATFKTRTPEDVLSVLQKAGLAAIEWSENMESELPADAVRIRIARGTSDSDRRITIQWPESRHETAQKMRQAMDAEKEAGAK